MSTSPGSTQNVTHMYTRDFSSNELRRLFTDSPITLVTNPGNGKAIHPISIVWDYKFGTHPYFASDGLGHHATVSSGSSTWALMQDFNLAIATSPNLVTLGSSVVPTNPFSGLLSTTTSNLIISPVAPAPSEALVILSRTSIENGALTLSVENSNFSNGTVLTTSINAAGTGYASGDTLADDAAWGNGDLLVTVHTVGGSGNVLTYTVTNVGTSGWHAVPPADVSSVITFSNVPPQSGAGSGFALNVTSIAQGDGTLRLTVQYQVLTLS